MAIPMKVIPGYENTRPGIQVGTKMEGPITYDDKKNIVLLDEGVSFLQQIGVEWVMVAGRQVPEHSAACYSDIRGALEERGLNPISQIVGYILSEDPTYITTHNNARNLVRRLDRDELLQVLVRNYIKKDEE